MEQLEGFQKFLGVWRCRIMTENCNAPPANCYIFYSCLRLLYADFGYFSFQNSRKTVLKPLPAQDLSVTTKSM
jgi:hypothetical protein